MAKSLIVRNLDDEIVARLRLRATRNGRSTEAEHREILNQASASESSFDFLELAEKFRELTKNRTHTRSEQLVREGR